MINSHNNSRCDNDNDTTMVKTTIMTQKIICYLQSQDLHCT